MKLGELHIYERVANSELSVDFALELLQQLRQENMATIQDGERKTLTRVFKYNEPYLRDHTVYGQQVLLGVTHVSMAIDAARLVYADQQLSNISNVLFINPVTLFPGETASVKILFEEAAGQLVFKSISEKDGQHAVLDSASGQIKFGNLPLPGFIDMESIKNSYERVVLAKDIYSAEDLPVLYGPALKTVQKVYFRQDEALGELILTDEILKGAPGYFIHPAIFDGAIVCAAVSVRNIAGEAIPEPFIPFMIKDIRIFGKVPYHCFCCYKFSKMNSEVVVGDLEICDECGEVLVELQGLTCKRARKQQFGSNIAGNAEGAVKINLNSRQQANVPKNDYVKTSLQDNIESFLLEQIAHYLGETSQTINVKKSFMDLGLDSGSLVDLTYKLGQVFRLELYPTLFFEYQNVKELAEFLSEEYKAELTRFFLAQSVTQERISGDKQQERQGTGNSQRYWAAGKAEALTQIRAVDKVIAIIGISGIMPQSDNLEIFWKNLLAKRELITEIPPERWDWQAVYGDPMQEGNRTNIKWGAFINDVDKFDALFFGISPHEAAYMDPKQRLLMQTVWKTIEDAGYKPSDLAGSKTGVFVGVGAQEYSSIIQNSNCNIEAYMTTGLAHTMLANRISYFFDLRGPSEPVDTACSSSLVAIHRAVEAIQSGHCDMAVAGGVNILLSPDIHIAFSKTGMLSSDGKCRIFDKAANGYVRGEGIGTLLLKPLQQAKADGDHIYAIIRGTAVNHGGRSNFLTAPNPNAQADLLISAYEQAQVDPATIGFIEVNSVGSSLGDSIEVAALNKAFQFLMKKNGTQIPKQAYCALGNTKGNIGHLEAASGVAGIFKVLFSLRHKKIPGIVNYAELNPYVRLEGSPFYIAGDTMPWTCFIDKDQEAVPRRAGISSFGFGGVNAHIILEEYRKTGTAVPLPVNPPFLFVLSAKNQAVLKDYVREMLAYLTVDGRETPVELAELVYTLQIGREAMEERLAIVVSTADELTDILTDYYNGKPNSKNIITGTATAHNSDSEAEPDFINVLLRERNLIKLAQLWVGGMTIEWKQLYINEYLPQRRPLPTYPFARHRHWAVEDKPVMKSGARSRYQANEVTRGNENACGNVEQIIPELKTIVGGLLKILPKDITVEKDVREYGMDSLTGMRLINRLQDKYKSKITMQTLFEYPTLQGLAGYLLGNGQLPNSPLNGAGSTATDRVNPEYAAYYEQLFKELAAGKITPQEAADREWALAKKTGVGE